MTRGLQAFNQQETMSFSEAIISEKEIQYTLTSDEAKEGISAFLEKETQLGIVLSKISMASITGFKV